MGSTLAGYTAQEAIGKSPGFLQLAAPHGWHAVPLLKGALIVVLLIYGLPLWKLRHQWRSTVYRRTDWKISILPWFGHDTAALFTNRYFQTEAERVMARRFRLYLAGYMALLALILWLP